MWTKKELEAAMNIKLPSSSADIFNQIVIDSRAVKPGDIFIGIKGLKHDGSEFVSQAIDNGAALCLVHNATIKDCKIIIFNDTYNDCLIALAKYNRNFKYKNSTFIGITGSVGKTTTKEMMYIAFKSFTKTYANAGNLNNLYGLPLSICNIVPNSDCCIFELGMSAPGEIEYLSKLLKPHIAIITEIALAHIASFNNLSAIAEAKSEIINGLEEGGTLIINYDAPYVKHIISKNKYKTMFYSFFNQHADVSLNHIKAITDGMQVTINIKSQPSISYNLGTIGDEFVLNSMAVLCALLLYNPEQITKAMLVFKDFRGLKGRGKIIDYKIIQLMDDSYNANPTSMVMALKRLEKTSSTGRKIVILGDMLELGNDAIKMHQHLIDIINQSKFDKIFCVGKLMYQLFNLINTLQQGVWTRTADEMAHCILEHLQPNDMILIKGSNGMQMSKICDVIAVNFSDKF